MFESIKRFVFIGYLKNRNKNDPRVHAIFKETRVFSVNNKDIQTLQ